MYVCIVPIPTVDVTAPALIAQTVGQSLTLQCKVTTVRGITSGVEFVWRRNGTELQRMVNLTSTTMSNSRVYTYPYIVSPLSTSDEGTTYQCEVVINASTPVMASDTTTLDVTGKCWNARCCLH